MTKIFEYVSKSERLSEVILACGAFYRDTLSYTKNVILYTYTRVVFIPINTKTFIFILKKSQQKYMDCKYYFIQPLYLTQICLVIHTYYTYLKDI